LPADMSAAQFAGIGAVDGGIQAAQVAQLAVTQHQGEVKCYNALNGYGFVTCPTIAGDVYFQRKDVPDHLQWQSLVGMTGDFTSRVTPDGKTQATDCTFSGTPTPQAESKAHGGKGGNAWLQSTIQAMTAQYGPVPPQYQAALRMLLGSGGWRKGGQDGDQQSGTVKYYNAEKGFGFITSPGVQGDIIFKSTEPVLQGQSVAFKVTWTYEGTPQAHDLSRAFEEGEQAVCTIRSYNAKTGYGFLVPSDRSQDVYFKKSELPEELSEAPKGDVVGCTVECTIGLQKDGRPIVKQMVLVARAEKRQLEGGTSSSEKRPRNLAEFMDSASVPSAEEKHSGRIRSINKRFGFIAPDSLPGDVYFKRDALPAQYQSTDLTGAAVRFALSWTEAGKPQAYEMEVSEV